MLVSYHKWKYSIPALDTNYFDSQPILVLQIKTKCMIFQFIFQERGPLPNETFKWDGFSQISHKQPLSSGLPCAVKEFHWAMDNKANRNQLNNGIKVVSLHPSLVFMRCNAGYGYLFSFGKGKNLLIVYNSFLVFYFFL